MHQFYLSQIVTKDKLIHQGIFYKPERSSKRAILWVHGLTSNFYGHVDMFDLFAEFCEKERLGFASFNNRGHDMLAGVKKLDRRKPKGYTHAYGGAGYERFEDCLYDIEAGVDFLVKQGFSQVVLVGQSTGANKVCYFAGKRKHPNVTGVVLASPTSDRLGMNDQKLLEQHLRHMQNLVHAGKGNELVVGYHYFPLTPKRFISLFEPRSPEDTFDYGDTQPKLKFFSKIRKPLLVILSEKDESLDRSIHDVRRVYDTRQRSTNYRSVVIRDALHSYNGKEKDVVQLIVNWTKTL